MEPVAVYEKAFTVGMRDVDFTGRLKLSALFSFFQEIASLHSANLGTGLETIMQKAGVTWALIRIRVEITRYPVMNEEIILETWPQQPRSLEFSRDFLVKDREGNILVRAVSLWAIIDVHTRKLKRSKLIAVDYPPLREERALDCKLSKLKPFGQLEMVYKRTIAYSDVDVNGHLNNTRYVDFIMDCFSLETHKAYMVKAIEFNYAHEALPGDTVVLYKDVSAAADGLVYIAGVNERDQRTAFQCRLEISRRTGP
ncbi:MAG TPA: thioesterase [Syntrophomonadaceae bacterium]|nr:acyl-ACP thioesterase [Syntrophomonadaceae bacterium]HOQ10623.1 thioesterase [Syntrophomonadaceae bacterium]HPU49393.1 thioesterase [Syntrophomonadaceae bacterium]